MFRCESHCIHVCLFLHRLSIAIQFDVLSTRFVQLCWGLQGYDSIKSQVASGSSPDTKPVLYVQDKAAISSCEAYSSSGAVPVGAESIFVCEDVAVGNGSDLMLMMLSDRPRAWSQRERAWGRAVSQKLSQTMR